MSAAKKAGGKKPSIAVDAAGFGSGSEAAGARDARLAGWVFAGTPAVLLFFAGYFSLTRFVGARNINNKPAYSHGFWFDDVFSSCVVWLWYLVSSGVESSRVPATKKSFCLVLGATSLAAAVWISPPFSGLGSFWLHTLVLAVFGAVQLYTFSIYDAQAIAEKEGVPPNALVARTQEPLSRLVLLIDTGVIGAALAYAPAARSSVCLISFDRLLFVVLLRIPQALCS